MKYRTGQTTETPKSPIDVRAHSVSGKECSFEVLTNRGWRTFAFLDSSGNLRCMSLSPEGARDFEALGLKINHSDWMCPQINMGS